MQQQWPWPTGSASGVGSLPGTNIREAVRFVLDLLPKLPHLPELPNRGPGADLTGRALALLPDFPAAWGPTGWALADRPGQDTRRSVSYLGEDLDAAEELLEGFDGAFKIQLCGPWTVAATIELRNGRKLVADRGAQRDLMQAYSGALAVHVASIASRLPQAKLIVQLDEPALPMVLLGGVPTPSGWGKLAGIEEPMVAEGLRLALAGLPPEVTTLAHCCASQPPLRLLRAAGFGGLSIDATLLTLAEDDALGEAIEGGLGLWLGLVPTDPLQSTEASRVSDLWHRLGQDPDRLSEAVVITPTCGLAGLPVEIARTMLGAATDAARQLSNDPEGTRE